MADPHIPYSVRVAINRGAFLKMLRDTGREWRAERPVYPVKKDHEVEPLFSRRAMIACASVAAVCVPIFALGIWKVAELIARWS